MLPVPFHRLIISLITLPLVLVPPGCAAAALRAVANRAAAPSTSTFREHRPMRTLRRAIIAPDGMLLRGRPDARVPDAHCGPRRPQWPARHSLQRGRHGRRRHARRLAGPFVPPVSLGSDVGSGQCNGSFTTTLEGDFPSPDGVRARARHARRAAQRRPGRQQRRRLEVETGADTDPTRPGLVNFQQSIAYDGEIDELDELVFAIRTMPASRSRLPPADLLALRATIDDRNNQPNATSTYSDLYQTSRTRCSSGSPIAPADPTTSTRTAP